MFSFLLNIGPKQKNQNYINEITNTAPKSKNSSSNIKRNVFLSNDKMQREKNKLQSDVIKPFKYTEQPEYYYEYKEEDEIAEQFKKRDSNPSYSTKLFSESIPNQVNTKSKYELKQYDNSKYGKDNESSLDKFNLITTIGKGTFGKIVLASLKQNPNNLFALKIIKKQYLVETNNVSHILNERRILQMIQCPFIVNLKFSFQNKEKIFLAFDYHPGGELFFHLQKRKRLPESEVKFYAAELYLALRYLHSKGILYRDIKPENIVLDKEGHIKLIDFGYSKKLVNKADHTNTIIGTNEYIRKLLLLIISP